MFLGTAVGFDENFKKLRLLYLTKFVILITMRLNKQQIEYFAFSIVKTLIKNDIILVDDREEFLRDIQMIITKELEKEDLLDEKVKEILQDKIEDIRNSNIDYYEMFKMVKSKLAKEENIIL